MADKILADAYEKFKGERLRAAKEMIASVVTKLRNQSILFNSTNNCK